MHNNIILVKKREDLHIMPSDIPQHVVNGFARATLRAVERYFEDPSIKAEFEAWKKRKYSNADK